MKRTSTADAAPVAPILEAGQFFGDVGAAWRTGLVTLTTLRHPRPRLVPQHAHEHMFLSLLLAGGYREWVGDRELAYEPLTVVFHPERFVHRDEITAADSVFFLVEIDPEILGPADRRRRALRSVHDLRGGPMVWAMLRLVEIARGHRRDGLECEEPVTEILDELIGERAAVSGRGSGAAPRWLARVEAQLRDEPCAAVSMRALAETAGVHPVHVARTFRRHHGCTMRVYLHRARVLRASRRIAAGGASLAAVAVDSGFCDQAHMTHVFKAITGMTPTRYRQLLGLESPRRSG